MSKVRQVDTHFWRDSWVEKLDRNHTYLFAYLITNPEMTMCGIYEISVRRMAFDTKLEQSEIVEMLKDFESDGKVFHREPWICIVNRPKYLKNLSRNHWLGITNELNGVDKLFIDAIPEAFWKGYESLMKGMAKQSNTLPLPLPFPFPFPLPFDNPPKGGSGGGEKQPRPPRPRTTRRPRRDQGGGGGTLDLNKYE